MAESTDSQRQQYRASMRAVASRLTPTALARVHAHVKEYKFYGSHEKLTAAVRAKYPEFRKKRIKGAFDKDGTCHRDGAGNLFGRPADIEEFHAHELSHAIDGAAHELTNKMRWHRAWAAEIRDSYFLSRNARKHEQEGWAEFGAMILGGEVTTREAQDIFPRCVAFWRSEYLL
jgi:hypothetical protein